MNNDNNDIKTNERKKITALIILIAVLMVTTTGATYAFFAFSAAATNSITGTAASASIAWKDSSTSCAATTPDNKAPAFIGPATAANQTVPMVPQKSYTGSTNVLQKAFNGASGKDKCIDGNNNAICHAYTFTIKNCSTATAILKGRIKFTWGTSSSFSNLKWKLMTNATTVAASSSDSGTIATTSFANFGTNVSLAPNAVKQYWLIVWIEETGANQNTTDHGTWYGTIEFVNNVDGSGITSTITS